MCGRFSLTISRDALIKRFNVNIVEDGYEPRYNVAPGQNILAITQEDPDKAGFYRWGLIPFWAKDHKIGSRLINARSETIAEKPSFKRSFARHRCLIPADGFYEWDKKTPYHMPYRVTVKERALFAFAGIYDYWKDDKGKEIRSCAIITAEADKAISRIHNRMPVMLHPKYESAWIDSELPLHDAEEILKNKLLKDMDIYPISPLINNPKNDQKSVLEPIDV